MALTFENAVQAGLLEVLRHRGIKQSITVSGLWFLLHTHTHTHTHMYMYIYTPPGNETEYHRRWSLVLFIRIILTYLIPNPT